MSSMFERSDPTAGQIGRLPLASEAIKALAILGTSRNLTPC